MNTKARLNSPHAALLCNRHDNHDHNHDDPRAFSLLELVMIIAIIAIVFGAATKIIVGRSREQTKREIAAYVAEGSIDPDKAVAMLNAGESVPHQKA